MNKLLITDGDKMDKDKPDDIKTPFVADSDTNFLHRVPLSIVGESQDIANGHNLQTLPQVGDVVVYDSNGCENGFTASVVQGEGSVDQIVGLTDKCDQISDLRDGFETSSKTTAKTAESISISNSSAVGQYLAGFSVNDINEDDSVPFIVNETESNHSSSNIQLGCTVIGANNELVPAIVKISGSSSVETANTNNICASTEKSDSQICSITNDTNTSEHNELEILREEQTVDTAVDETNDSNKTSEALSPIIKNDPNAEEMASLDDTTPQPLIESNVETKIRIENVSSRASLTDNSNVPLITISSDSESESHSLPAIKTVDRFYSNASYTCHLCDIVFKESETLNEHMILHRNNRIIDAKARDKSKINKTRYVSCYICKKQLPTQCLQNHIAIHKKKKPCKKELNSNNRTRRLEQDQRNRNLLSPIDCNQTQKVDFNRLSGPLIIKRLLISGKNDRNVDSGNNDNVTPSNVFSNVENIVMNPARFIVRVDRMDANTVKRRIASPDISIDESFEKKRRVSLSPLVLNRNNVKLDEIENIILDNSEDEKADDSEPNRVNEIEPLPEQNLSHHGKLTEDELFALLDDESPKVVEKSDERELGSALSSSSLKPAVTISTRVRSVPSLCEDENGDDLWDRYDAFDLAFHKVALRRLALLRKRASETDGKIDRKYLLGPRFWRKTVHRAELRRVELEPTASIATTTLIDRNNRLDNRETNDMTKLQARAERKFSCLLNKLQLSNNPNGWSLWGPLFWKRTLRLAGVKTVANLNIFLKDAPTNLDGIEFVDANEIARLRLKSRTKRLESKKKAGLEFLHTPTNEPKRIVVEPSSQVNSPARLIDLTSPPPPPPPPPRTSLGSTSMMRSSDMLYESLTKRKDNTIALKSPVVIKKETQSKAVARQKMSSLTHVSKPKPKPETRRTTTVMTENALHSTTDENNETTTSNSIIQSGESVLIEGDYILNVDGSGALQLVSAAASSTTTTTTTVDDKSAVAATKGEVDANYMLISDDAGNMQYMLNVPTKGELTNFQFFDGGIGGDSSSGTSNVVGNEEQQQRHFTYTVQFDGENSTSLPIIENTDTIMTLPNVVADEQSKPKMNSVNVIGRELSDFINLDLSSATESGQADNGMSTS